MISGESCKMIVLSEQISERCCSIRHLQTKLLNPKFSQCFCGATSDNFKGGSGGWPDLES